MNLGEKLKKLRENKNITLKEVNKDLGICTTTLSNYEMGDRLPRVDVAAQLAEYYGVSLDWLVS